MQRETDYALTFALKGALVMIEERPWTIAEVARNGDVLAFKDAPCWDYPGVAHYKWHPGPALAEAIQEWWDR